MPARTGAITDAGSSIVEYERWLESGDQQILDDIEAYNRDDVESTWLLRDWLLRVRDGEVAEDHGDASVGSPGWFAEAADGVGRHRAGGRRQWWRPTRRRARSASASLVRLPPSGPRAPPRVTTARRAARAMLPGAWTHAPPHRAAPPGPVPRPEGPPPRSAWRSSRGRGRRRGGGRGGPHPGPRRPAARRHRRGARPRRRAGREGPVAHGPPAALAPAGGPARVVAVLLPGARGRRARPLRGHRGHLRAHPGGRAGARQEVATSGTTPSTPTRSTSCRWAPRSRTRPPSVATSRRGPRPPRRVTLVALDSATGTLSLRRGTPLRGAPPDRPDPTRPAQDPRAAGLAPAPGPGPARPRGRRRGTGSGRPPAARPTHTRGRRRRLRGCAPSRR